MYSERNGKIALVIIALALVAIFIQGNALMSIFVSDKSDIIRAEINSDSIIENYIKDWESHHKGYSIDGNLAIVDVSKNCLCYEVKFKNEGDAGFFKGLKVKLYDKRRLRGNIKARIEEILEKLVKDKNWQKKDWDVNVSENCESFCK